MNKINRDTRLLSTEPTHHESIEQLITHYINTSVAVVTMLDNLGVAPENILYDDFGGQRLNKQ